jgi:predicted transcriptional regulator
MIMSEPASLFDDVDEEGERLAIAKARADVAAGRVVPHEAVVKWLQSWGTPDELQCPTPEA